MKITGPPPYRVYNKCHTYLFTKMKSVSNSASGLSFPSSIAIFALFTGLSKEIFWEVYRYLEYSFTHFLLTAQLVIPGIF